MPYIPQDQRERLTPPYVTDVGSLEYSIVRMGEELAWKLSGYDYSKLTREHIAQVSGGLAIAHHEFLRRISETFEDQQRALHGDVFVLPHPEQWDVGEDDDEAAAPTVISLVKEDTA